MGTKSVLQQRQHETKQKLAMKVGLAMNSLQELSKCPEQGKWTMHKDVCRANSNLYIKNCEPIQVWRQTKIWSWAMMTYALFILTLVKLTFHLFEKSYSLSMTLGLIFFLSLNMVYSVKGKEREGGEKKGLRRSGLSHLIQRVQILKHRKSFWKTQSSMYNRTSGKLDDTPVSSECAIVTSHYHFKVFSDRRWESSGLDP